MHAQPCPTVHAWRRTDRTRLPVCMQASARMTLPTVSAPASAPARSAVSGCDSRAACCCCCTCPHRLAGCPSHAVPLAAVHLCSSLLPECSAQPLTVRCRTVPTMAPAVRQALAIAALCEFGGAVLMGSGVTETIRDQVADLSYFENKPDMCAALDFDMIDMMSLGLQAGMPLGTRGNCTRGRHALM